MGLGCCIGLLPLLLQDRPEHGISKQSYMQAVLEGLRQHRKAEAAAAAAATAAAAAPQQPGSSMLVKFLLSIDRRNDTAAALDTVWLLLRHLGRTRAVQGSKGDAGAGA